MDFRDILKIAQRRWKSIAVIFAFAIMAASALSFTATKQYESTARIFVSNDVSDATEAYYASAFGTARVQSYAQLATSGEVLNHVINRLNLNMTNAELASQVHAGVEANTVIIDVQARNPQPRLAQEIAQATAAELTNYISDVETPVGKSTAPVKATITGAADFNGTPVTPRTALNIIVAAIIGLILGAAVATLRDLLDNSVKSSEDIEKVSKSAVMATVAHDSTVNQSPLISELNSLSPRTEAFRLLRTNLQFLNLDSEPRAFVITSALPGEGKTWTATNLAIALAQTGGRVLLVDGDLRRPRVASLLKLEPSVGLTTVLIGRSTLDESIQTHSSGIHVLASGPIPPNPTEVLQSRATRELLARFKDFYDYVIIDAPPLLPVADAAILTTDADGAIVVVRHGKTSREQLRHSLERLDQVGTNLFGFVVNMAPKRNKFGYGYGYSYYGEYQPLQTLAGTGDRSANANNRPGRRRDA